MMIRLADIREWRTRTVPGSGSGSGSGGHQIGTLESVFNLITPGMKVERARDGGQAR